MAFNVSAKTGDSVNQMFTEICDKLINISKMRAPSPKKKQNKKIRGSS